jgi:glycosyltransferase involved in cell wall biosynthesis
MISVCIATYNGEMFIRKQLDSILKQLDDKDEVIISDDCSTDSTLEIIRSMNDRRIKIFSNIRYKSLIFNFENALKQANGDIIFLSDQDDIWVDDKVKNYLNKIEAVDLVFSNVSIIDENDSIVNNQILNEIPKYSLLNLIISNHVIGATIAIKSGLLEKALPFPNRIPMHDQWLAIIANYYGKIGYIEEPMLLYRRHLGNASYCTEESKNSVVKKIKFRLETIICFINRIAFNMFRSNYLNANKYK